MKRLPIYLILIALVLTACGAGRQPLSKQQGGAEGEAGVASDAAASEPEMVEREFAEEEAAAEAPMADADGAGQDDSMSSQAVSAWDRKIIKNATVKLEADEVLDVQRRITTMSRQYGGYVVESRTWYDNENRPHALYSFAVPVESFEQALTELKSYGKVLDEQTSGQDVTDQYVDLEARIENLEATAARIRSFLDDARSVEEALSVNQRLSQVEEELERLKGQRNALEQRADFSTITVEISPVVLEETLIEETTVWSPAKTLEEATEVLMVMVQWGIDAAIWLSVLGLPVVVVLGILALVGRRLLPNRTIQP